MQNNRPLATAAQVSPNEALAPDSVTSSVSPTRADVGKLLALPPGRARIHADIRAINRQCFLMVCDMHRGILSSLGLVPGKLIIAAENLLKPQDAATRPELWSETLVHYAKALTDARGQVVAAAKLHGVADAGRRAAVAIDSIEKALPVYLAAAKSRHSQQDALATSASQLSEASMTLTVVLTELLETVESAIERAKSLDRPVQT